MDKESTMFGLSPEKLAKVFKIGSSKGQTADRVNKERSKSELLNDWLSAPLPLDQAVAESLPMLFGRMYQELRPFAGESIGDMLLKPKATISMVQRVKDYSKKLVTSAKSEAEHDVAATVYYVAIASALVFHGKRITRFSYEDLKDSFTTLSKNSWLTAEVAHLLQKACELCQRKADGKS